ncbi:ankyrin repeat domain-containing protein, partial [Lysinibacillus mangiferihumi]
MENITKIFNDNADIFYKIYDSIRNDDVKSLDNILIKYPELLNVPVYGNTERNESLLHFAASREKKNTCLYLIDKGISVNIVDCWYCTPLEYAAGQGDIEWVKKLMSINAWVDGDCRGIITPLISAVIEGHREIVKYLLDCGADINRLHRRLNQTPLDLATVYGHQDIIALLKTRGG